MEKVITLDLLRQYNYNLINDIPLLRRDFTYAIGDIVKKAGITLKCITAGITKTDTLDLSSIGMGNAVSDGTVTWVRINPYSNITEWKSGSTYTENDIVLHEGAIYKSTRQNNDTNFSRDNFELAVYNTKIQAITNKYIDVLFEGLQ